MGWMPAVIRYILVCISAFLLGGWIGSCLRRKQLMGRGAGLWVGIFNGSLWLLTFALKGFHIGTLLAALAISVLLAISIIDIKTMEIPPSLNLFLFALGAGKLVLGEGQLLSCLAGLAGIPALLLLVYLITGGKGIGGGDIKLMAASGFFLGFAGNLAAFLFGGFYACVAHLPRRKREGRGSKFAKANTFAMENAFAMAPYLSAGILTVIWFGGPVIGWYLGLG